MRILLVEDELSIARNLKDVLEKSGYSVALSTDGEDGLDKALSEEFDLLILDIMLPKMDGLSLLKKIRKEKNRTPVLMLTARSSIDDKVRGLDEGADDYLSKPFAVPELLARIRTLLRRKSDVTEGSDLKIANFRIDVKSKKVFRGKKEIILTPKEFSLIEFLFYNKDVVVTRTAIAEHVWGDNFDIFTMSNFVDVHVMNVRKKIDKGFHPKLIHTRHGLGYVLSDKEQ